MKNKCLVRGEILSSITDFLIFLTVIYSCVPNALVNVNPVGGGLQIDPVYSDRERTWANMTDLEYLDANQ